ncbi:MAG: hypothetical protein PUA56_04955 [Bacillales bacterium]|nr:hypothetical protein [Bacillales bacterium]
MRLSFLQKMLIFSILIFAVTIIVVSILDATIFNINKKFLLWIFISAGIIDAGIMIIYQISNRFNLFQGKKKRK